MVCHKNLLLYINLKEIAPTTQFRTLPCSHSSKLQSIRTNGCQSYSLPRIFLRFIPASSTLACPPSPRPLTSSIHAIHVIHGRPCAATAVPKTVETPSAPPPPPQPLSLVAPCGIRNCAACFKLKPLQGRECFCKPVWPSGKALGWYSRRTSVRIRFGSPFSSKIVVCGHCLVTLSLTINET